MNLELSREATIDLVSYRADKRFKIFSWSSSLLIGTIAGQAFFRDTPLQQTHKMILATTILVLATHSLFWLHLNSRALHSALNHLMTIEAELEVIRPAASSEPRFLYEATLGLLSALAFGMTLAS